MCIFVSDGIFFCLINELLKISYDDTDIFITTIINETMVQQQKLKKLINSLERERYVKLLSLKNKTCFDCRYRASKSPQICFVVVMQTTFFLISKEMELRSHEITRLLLLIHNDNTGELFVGFTCVPSISPNLSLAERAILIDRLQVL